MRPRPPPGRGLTASPGHTGHRPGHLTTPKPPSPTAAGDAQDACGATTTHRRPDGSSCCPPPSAARPPARTSARGGRTEAEHVSIPAQDFPVIDSRPVVIVLFDDQAASPDVEVTTERAEVLCHVQIRHATVADSLPNDAFDGQLVAAVQHERPGSADCQQAREALGLSAGAPDDLGTSLREQRLTTAETLGSSSPQPAPAARLGPSKAGGRPAQRPVQDQAAWGRSRRAVEADEEVLVRLCGAARTSPLVRSRARQTSPLEGPSGPRGPAMAARRTRPGRECRRWMPRVPDASPGGSVPSGRFRRVLGR
ncbi:DUF6879 family protein [Streptomyces sp. NPDC004288]